MTVDDTELDGTLAALRGYVLSCVVQALLAIDLLDALEPGLSRDELRARLGCGDAAGEALLHYLLNEDVIVRTEPDRYALTERGRRFNRQRGWFRLFVGGYGPVLRSLPELLRHGIPGEVRDMSAVAQGSGEISHFDAVPLVTRLIELSGRACRQILDVGCGNGELLCQLLARLPGARGIAADPSPVALAETQRTVAAHALGDRVRLVEGDGFEIPDPQPAPDFLLAAFTLQEILGQSGEEVLVARMAAAADRWPDAGWLVVEVDHQPAGAVLRTAHGLGFYNPYYLFHPLTRQTLLPREGWHRLFERAGLAVEAVLTTDPAVDATGLELGFLLRRTAR